MGVGFCQCPFAFSFTDFHAFSDAFTDRESKLQVNYGSASFDVEFLWLTGSENHAAYISLVVWKASRRKGCYTTPCAFTPSPSLSSLVLDFNDHFQHCGQTQNEDNRKEQEETNTYCGCYVGLDCV